MQNPKVNQPHEIVEDVEDQSDEDYQIWKNNAPLLYDTLVSHMLEWPSLTVQYLPQITESDNLNFMTQNLILGTNAPPEEQNYLMVVKCRTPNLMDQSGLGNKDFSVSRLSESLLKAGLNCIEIETKIAHPGEINRARCSYAAQNLIATKSVNGNVLLFDYTKHPPSPKDIDYCPQMILAGHEAQGFALDWKYSKELQLISGDNDGVICFWDLEKAYADRLADQADPAYRNHDINEPKDLKLMCQRKFDNFKKAINEIKFHRINTNIFAHASEDGHLIFRDLRTEGQPFFDIEAHTEEVFSLDFSYKDEFLFLSGGSDGLVRLWDMREISQSVHYFEKHNGKVLRVEWNPNNEFLFASSGDDKCINIWDCGRIGDDVLTEDHPDGPPELIFKHKGHQDKVEDICWNPNSLLGIASTDAAGCLQVWKMDDDIYFEDL